MKVTPFGFSNVPAMFECLMNACLVDDSIIVRRMFEEPLRNTQRFVEKLKMTNLTIKPSKCNLFRCEVSHLGSSYIPSQSKITIPLVKDLPLS